MLIIHRPLPHHPPELLHNRPLPLRRPPDSKVHPGIQRRLPVPRVRADHDAARLAEDAPARTHVPGIAPALPVQVEAPLGDGAEVEGRGPQAAQAVHHRAPGLLARRQPPERLDLDVKVGPVPAAPPLHGHQRRGQVAQRGGGRGGGGPRAAAAAAAAG